MQPAAVALVGGWAAGVKPAGERGPAVQWVPEQARLRRLPGSGEGKAAALLRRAF